ncbi:MAG: hypothetical protein M3340_00120 [Actinomycetota bacterium]|nr:hypothetical protein [Actinomycetota bacterium]
MAIGVVSASRSEGQGELSGRSANAVELVTGMDRSTVSLMHVFRRPPTPDDVLAGARVLRDIQRRGDVQPGENPGITRRLALGGGHTALVWLRRRGVCYGSPGPAGCFPTRVLRERGVVFGAKGASDRTTVRMFAIARDAIDEVTFTLRGGATVTVPVADNGLLVDLPRPPVEARWRNPDGSIGSQRGLVPYLGRLPDPRGGIGAPPARGPDPH